MPQALSQSYPMKGKSWLQKAKTVPALFSLAPIALLIILSRAPRLKL